MKQSENWQNFQLCFTPSDKGVVTGPEKFKYSLYSTKYSKKD